MALAKQVNVNIMLGKCAFYDTIILHGGGNDQDSLGAIVNRTITKMGGKGVHDGNEKEWVTAFLAMRREDLMNPRGHEKARQILQNSVERVDAMTELIKLNNWEMKPPMRIKTVHHDRTIH